MFNTFPHFALNQWLLINKNTTDLFKTLSEDEKKVFNFDVENINWKKYFEIYTLGIKKFMIKEQ